MVNITAAVVRTKGAPFEIEELVLEEPRADEVLVKLVATGLCHTDIYFSHFAEGPTVLGHEGSGVIEKVGASVRGFAPGDRVMMSFNSCGSCASCLKALPAYCESFVPLNMSGARSDGSTSIHAPNGESVASNFFGQSSFASYALASPRTLVKVPDEVTEELFQILGPLGCGIQTGAGGVLNALDPAAGSSIVISGAGAVGLSAVLGAKISQASTIIVIDINAERLEIAKRLGATHVIDGTKVSDATAEIKSITGGGADYAVDTTGNMEVIRTLVGATHSSGVTGLIGMGKPGASLVLDHSIMALGRTVKGIVEGDSVPQLFIPQLIKLHLQGDFPFDEFITLYPFDKVQQATDDSESGSTIKAVLVF
jgi:aryl-alcohol dehydrogenase